MSEPHRYPLVWPENWPVSKFHEPSRFGDRSIAQAWEFLCDEMRRLGTKKWLMSSNVKRNANGAPYSNARPDHPGVAVYFDLNGRQVSLACDKWNRVEDNIWAIAKHIEALRGQERWGVGTMEQAFRGYMALPGVGDSSASDWYKTLGVAINASEAQVKEAYRLLVKKHHPDRGGDPEFFNRVQRAMERFESTVKTNNQ